MFQNLILYYNNEDIIYNDIITPLSLMKDRCGCFLHIFMHVCMCVYTCLCVCVHLEPKGQYNIFLCLSSYYSLRHGLCLNLELTD